MPSTVIEQCTDWEKIFVNYVSDKSMANRVYEELLKCNRNRNKNPIQTWAKDMDRHFSETDIQMANKHIKRCQHP